MPSLLPVDEERPTNLLDYAPTSDADVGLLGRIGDWITRQQQKSADMGLWTGGQAWEGGHPTGKGVTDAGLQMAGNFEGGLKFAPHLTPNLPRADTISTRVPTSVKFTGDAHGDDSLIIDRAAMRESGDAYTKNADLIRNGDYPGLKVPEGATDEEVYDLLHDHVKDNLRFLYDNVPDAVRERAPQWYPGGNKLLNNWASDYDVLPRQVAGTIASLSPQKVWDENVSLAKRILDVRRDKGDMVMTPEMSELIQGYAAAKKNPKWQQHVLDAHATFEHTPFGELNDPLHQAYWTRAYDEAHNDSAFQLVSPEGRLGEVSLKKDGTPAGVSWGSFGDIAKAHSVLNDGTVDNVSASMGSNHKVRNFYNNLIDPTDPRHVTIDTHAVAAAHLLPLGGNHEIVTNGLGLSGSASNATGAKGLYGVYADAYRDLGKELNIPPRALQSVTWEGLRGLFSPAQKRDKNLVADVNNIWRRHTDGEIDGPAARQLIFDRSGGIDNPGWVTINR